MKRGLDNTQMIHSSISNVVQTVTRRVEEETHNQVSYLDLHVSSWKCVWLPAMWCWEECVKTTWKSFNGRITNHKPKDEKRKNWSHSCPLHSDAILDEDQSARHRCEDWGENDGKKLSWVDVKEISQPSCLQAWGWYSDRLVNVRFSQSRSW